MPADMRGHDAAHLCPPCERLGPNRHGVEPTTELKGKDEFACTGLVMWSHLLVFACALLLLPDRKSVV